MWDRALCINLESRTDRREQSAAEFERWGISVTWLSALTGTNGMQGLHLSNQKIFRDFRGESLLVLEDDVIFTRPLSALTDAYNDLPPDWDVLYLGGNAQRNQKRHSNWLYRADGILTTHAILYSRKMTEWLADNLRVPDVVDRSNTIDVWLMKEVQPRFNCFIAYPQIAAQRFGYSDICGMNINYKFFNNHSKKYFT